MADITLSKYKNQNKTPLIIYYQGLLAFASIILFFNRLDVYLQEHTPLIPLYWLLGFMVASIPVIISLYKSLERLSIPIVIWSGIFTAFSAIIILIQPEFPELQYLEDHFRTIIFLFLMMAIFAYHPLITRWIKLTIMSVTLVNVVFFIYEFFNPLAFYVDQRSAGRSSGFYDDSNTASIALIVGMISTIDLIKPKYRLFYALFIFLGIAPTFSRGSTAGWVLVVILFMAFKVIPRYQFSLLLVSILVAISILSTQLNNLTHLETSDGTRLFQKDTLSRVEFIINPLAQNDTSKAARIGFLEKSWQKFQQRPFIGYGLSAGEDESTVSLTGKAERSHNTFLDLMIEYGFLGGFIFPSILLCCVWQAQGEFKKQAVVFVIFMLSQGFFSHTLLSEFCSLIFYPMMGNLTLNSRMEEFKLAAE